MVFDAAHIFRTLAERSLGQRKVHLWIGDDLILQWLSPYVRDLRDVITAWAQQPIRDEDTFYELLPNFIATDPRLAEERSRADRSVGLSHHSAGFDVIDTARLDPAAWDPRLKCQSSNAVIVRIDPHAACDLEQIALAPFASVRVFWHDMGHPDLATAPAQVMQTWLHEIFSASPQGSP